MYSHTTLIFSTIMSGYNSKKRRAGRNYNDTPVTPSGRTVILPTLTEGRGSSVIDEPSITQPSDKGRLTGLPAGQQGSTAYSDLLRYFSQNGNSQVLDLLSQLGINGLGSMSETQSADWNKQLLDQMIAQMSEEDKRKYNEGRLSEQRLYDSPLNQLARLMGAGISRDAALQMLTGSASGSGSVVTGDAAALAGGLAPSESNKNAVDVATGIANTVFNGVNALAGLVNIGFTVPQALQQLTFLKNQNFLTSKQIQAYSSADAAFSILHNAKVGADAFGSVASAADAITTLAANGNTDAQAFINSGGIQQLTGNATFASHTLGNLYKAERSSRDYAQEYIANMRKLNADASLSEINYTKVCQEIVNAQAEYDRILADTDFIRANEVATRALAGVYNNQVNLIKEQTTAQEYANQETAAIFAGSYDGMSYLDWRQSDALQHVVTSAKIAAKTNNPEYIDAVYKEMFNTAEATQAIMSLKKLQMDSGISFATKHPQQFELYNGLVECHVYDYAEMRIKAASSAHGGNSIWSGSIDLGTDEIDELKGDSFWKKFFNWKPLQSQ